MTRIIQKAATLVSVCFFRVKKSGNPIRIAAPNNMSCRFVSPKATFVFTLFKSFGTFTYATMIHLPDWRGLMIYAYLICIENGFC